MSIGSNDFVEGMPEGWRDLLMENMILVLLLEAVGAIIGVNVSMDCCCHCLVRVILPVVEFMDWTTGQDYQVPMTGATIAHPSKNLPQAPVDAFCRT